MPGIMSTKEAALLLQGLERQRDDLGPLAEDLIALLRSRGVRPLQSEEDLSIPATPEE
jgi:hypothetical protein